MTPTVQNRFIIRKRLAITFVIVSLLIILLGLLGYFWLPGFAKSKLETILSETIQRPVTVQSIDFHLYSLELTVHELHIGKKNATNADKTLFSFEKLYVDVSFDSVTRKAPVITAITLNAPKLSLVREGKQQFNITDLIEKFTQPSEDDDDQESSKTHFSISNITITNGYFELVDHFKKSHQKISAINLGIPFVANFESTQATWIEPHFNAKINGAPIYLDGKVRPFASKLEATLVLKLSNIDLTHIDEYSPIPTGISLLSGYFDSDLVVTFSQTPDEPPSVSLSGHAALRKLAINNQAVEAPYHAALSELNIQLPDIDLMGLKPSHVGIALSNITLTRKGESKPVLSLPKLTVDSILIDMAKQHVVLDKIFLNRFNASIQREKNGTIDLTRLFASNSHESLPSSVHKANIPIPGIPIPGRKPSAKELIQVADQKGESKSDPAPKVDSVKQVTTSEKAWTTQINYFKLSAASLSFNDTTLTEAVPMVISSLDLTLDKIDLSGIKPLNLTLQAKVNQRGNINTKGSLAWAPLATELDIDLNEVDLVSMQGWAGDKFNALLTRGAVSFQGKIKADGEPLKVSINGQGKLSDFNIFDKVSTSDLLRWKKLDINGINFINEPLQIDIASIELGDFFALVKISPNGDLNLKKIVKQDETEADTPSTTTTTTAPADKTMPIHIGKIFLQQGNINFNDRFIKPNYRANLTKLSGQIGPLHPNKPGKIEIRGAVDKSAPLEIKGTIEPFSSELQLDILAKVKGIDLPPFSPYSSKYIGYEIDKGKLSVDIHYQIENGLLKAENNIFLDQLTLGNETDNPDAPSLPLSLAISLLKNRQGEIDIHLPIEGSLNDPKFSIGGIVFDAFVNLIMKAVTSPFALLGSVLSGGEELSNIDFAPGYAEIEAEAEKRLQTLSQALIDRPALKLEITGFIDPEKDREGLKHALLERKVKAYKLAIDAEKGITSGALDDIELDTEQYTEYLTLVYEDESFEKPTNILGLTKSLPVPEMEQLILKNIEVSNDNLQDLAEQRADAARNWLIDQGGIANDRVFVLGAETETDESKTGSRAEFSLK
tara:strand:- start:1986 stop:5177 length:3192 start_codon:yes stop_codon:yes gene_type:complete